LVSAGLRIPLLEADPYSITRVLTEKPAAEKPAAENPAAEK